MPREVQRVTEIEAFRSVSRRGSGLQNLVCQRGMGPLTRYRAEPAISAEHVNHPAFPAIDLWVKRIRTTALRFLRGAVTLL